MHRSILKILERFEIERSEVARRSRKVKLKGESSKSSKSLKTEG